MDTVQNGKGSRARPVADPKGFETNFERIFGTKPRKDADPETGGDEQNGQEQEGRKR